MDLDLFFFLLSKMLVYEIDFFVSFD